MRVDATVGKVSHVSPVRLLNTMSLLMVLLLEPVPPTLVSVVEEDSGRENDNDCELL